MAIETFKNTPLIDEGLKAARSPDATRELGRFIRSRNNLILLQANVYEYNPNLSYREKVTLAERGMYMAWRGLHQLGYPVLADTLLKIGDKPYEGVRKQDLD